MSNFSNHGIENGHWGKPEEKKLVQLETLKCQNCFGLISVVPTKGKVRDEIATFPLAIPSANTAVPAPLAEDYIEGVECLSIGKNKAAACMFRRSLQQVMLEKQAKGNRLVDQIRSLAQVGTIPQEIADWADEIRLWGNEGAHPSNDGLDTISNDEALELKDFVERLFEWVYIMPDKVAQSKSARASKKANDVTDGIS